MEINEKIPSTEECAASLKNVVDAMYVLNGKWKLALTLCLMHSPKRFNEIQLEMAGISAKVLSAELKDLELNYLIERIVYSTVPETIIYQATDYSRSLRNVLRELSSWGEGHCSKIKEER
ncbi:MAG TPA: winged helix-turn-helix transcriptional regulator [Flavobacterium sp.]|jgi:DNA-binding HxlR family transcriptional regulator